MFLIQIIIFYLDKNVDTNGHLFKESRLLKGSGYGYFKSLLSTRISPFPSIFHKTEKRERRGSILAKQEISIMQIKKCSWSWKEYVSQGLYI